MYTVYVLYSRKFEKHYTGFNSNLEERFKSHNAAGKKGWSRRCRPWELIHREEFEDKGEAMKRERWLKSGAGREYIKGLKQ